MSRDDLRTLAGLDINFASIGLLEPGLPQEPYFCTPEDAEYVGRLGVDGVHFVLLPGDERVFCVDPAMGDVGTYVLPVAANLREFLAFLLYCRDAGPLSQIWWLTEERFSQLLREDAQADWPGREAFPAEKERAMASVAAAFQLSAREPYQPVRAMQAAFDPGALRFSDEYYDTLGLERE